MRRGRRCGVLLVNPLSNNSHDLEATGARRMKTTSNRSRSEVLTSAPERRGPDSVHLDGAPMSDRPADHHGPDESSGGQRLLKRVAQRLARLPMNLDQTARSAIPLFLSLQL